MASNPPTGLGNALAAFGAGNKLTESQRTEIAELLYAKLGSRACEMCAHPSWAIGDNIVQPVPLQINLLSKSYSQDFTASFPSVHLVCTNCGNTKLFLLSQLGYDPFQGVR
jgi:hypothetical protein